MRNTLSRSESLKSYKLIRLLFSEGEVFFSYPYKVLFLAQKSSDNVPVRFLISVSKKKIRTAVARNKIKRLFRESYRQNKHQLFDYLIANEKKIILAFIYVGDMDPEYNTLKDKTVKALEILLKNLAKE